MTIHVRTIVLLQCNHCKVHFCYAHSGSNSVTENREQRISPNSVCLFAPARSKFGIYAHKCRKNVLPFPAVVFSGFLVIFKKNSPAAHATAAMRCLWCFVWLSLWFTLATTATREKRHHRRGNVTEAKINHVAWTATLSPTAFPATPPAISIHGGNASRSHIFKSYSRSLRTNETLIWSSWFQTNVSSFTPENFNSPNHTILSVRQEEFEGINFHSQRLVPGLVVCFGANYDSSVL
jgi:hypothetical protein